MMQRMACFGKIRDLRDGAIVVSTYTSAFEWHRVDPNPLNFVSVGAMGQASSHALGLAIGLPDQKIIVLDGDGSLLMNLSTLTTIANAAPKNLVHFVVENGTYEANGGHPTPARGTADFAGLASAAGYAEAHSYEGLNQFAADLPDLLAARGPVFAALKVEAGDAPPLDYDYDWLHHADRRQEFREALKPLLKD
ncbi:MAG: thiamine pyrophosphate-dependent enzyme [Alphaproteobacteria bacterium]